MRHAIVAILALSLSGCAGTFWSNNTPLRGLRRGCIVNHTLAVWITEGDLEDMDKEIRRHLVPARLFDGLADFAAGELDLTAAQAALLSLRYDELVAERAQWQRRYAWQQWLKWKPPFGFGPYEDWKDWERARKRGDNR